MEISYRGFLWLIFALLILVLLGLGGGIMMLASINMSHMQPNQVSLGNTTITVAVADTPLLRAKGLGGKTVLSDSEGMIFPLDAPEEQVFWMKGMLIPIDIIWVRHGTIVGIEKSVVPEPDVADADLKRYPSPIEVDAVIEVAAGFSERHRVSVGDGVHYSGATIAKFNYGTK